MQSGCFLLFEFDFQTNFWNNVTYMTRYFLISDIIFIYFSLCCPVAMEKKRVSLSQLIPGTLVIQHLQSCKLDVSDCGLCAVHESWKLHQREWVRVTLEDGVAKLGCSVCCGASLDGPWAEFKQKPGAVLRKHCLDRHEKSKAHQQALKSHSDRTVLHLAPPAKLFQECLRNMMQGQSVRAGGVTSDKAIKMRWALTEAILARNRKMLSQCHSLALMRDERKGKLLVRYRAVLTDLSTISGCFGMVPVSGSAESIAQATDALMEAFCVEKKHPPRASKVEESAVDTGLLQHLRDSVIIIVTDAAASEQLATDLQRGRRNAADDTQASMTNIKLVGRDAAHASTRLLKRPFQACTELKCIMTEWCHGADSFAQKVQHSTVLSQWWAAALECRDEDSDFGCLTSLAAAKHRFSSYLNPLSRICKNMQTVFKVCSRLQAMRGSEALWAIQLCRNFTSYKAVLLTMAADACAISNDYTRECDREDMDVAQLNLRAQRFISSARALFVERKVCTLPSFTKDLLLRREPVTILQDGFALEVRVTQADLDKAFAVMEDIRCQGFTLYNALFLSIRFPP